MYGRAGFELLRRKVVFSNSGEVAPNLTKNQYALEYPTKQRMRRIIASIKKKWK